MPVLPGFLATLPAPSRTPHLLVVPALAALRRGTRLTPSDPALKDFFCSLFTCLLFLQKPSA